MTPRATPLFPEIAQAEGEQPPPFEPWLVFPEWAGFDPNLKGAELKILGAIRNGSASPAGPSVSSRTRSLPRRPTSLASVPRSLKFLEEGEYVRRMTVRVRGGNARAIVLCFRTFAPSKRGNARSEHKVHTHLPRKAHLVPMRGCADSPRKAHRTATQGTPVARARSLPIELKMNSKRQRTGRLLRCRGP